MAALVISLVIFVVSLGLLMPYWFQYPSGYHLRHRYPWISSPPIRYHVGLDGLSLWLVMLYHAADADRGAGFLEVHRSARQGILRVPDPARVRPDRRVRRARSVPVLRVLGSVAGARCIS